MTTLASIFTFGLAMSAIAIVGAVTLILRSQTWDGILLPLVESAAGSLIGGALCAVPCPEAATGR